MRPWRLVQYAVSMTWILLLLVGCGALESAPEAVAASSEKRIESPDVPRTDLRELAAGNNAFTFDLYQAIRDGEDNLFYSPYSISVALAMTYAGAQGNTEQQMADTLHFTLPQERLHPAFNALDLELVRSGRNFQLNIANAVWGQKGYPFLPEYLDVLAQNYGAGIRLADFEKDATAAVDAINRWISDETEGRIQDIVSDLGEYPGLVLANAIYFNAKWELPFDEKRTKYEPFHLLDGGKQKVPMMHQTSHFDYTEGDGYQAIQLPYLNREVAMVVILPQEDRFQEIEGQLSAEWVQLVLNGFRNHEVILTMPKFRLEPPLLRLKEALTTMGMPDAFSSTGTDFFGIIEREPDLRIWIGNLLHKAFIDVDEKRTEAAAASVAIMELEKGIEPTKPPPTVMRIDRPFIFFIRDIETDTILFVGRVMNPISA